MPVWVTVLLVILAILLVAFIALMIFGNKLRKKQESQQAQIDAAKQVMSMLVNVPSISNARILYAIIFSSSQFHLFQIHILSDEIK